MKNESPSIRATTEEAKLFYVRLLQEFVYLLFRTGRIKVPIHFAFGHEWIAVSVTQKISRQVFLPHRNIHYNLALCFSLCGELDVANLVDYLNEIMLTRNSFYRGFIGSMNYTRPNSGLYTSSILANQLGVALGHALASKYTEDNSRVAAVLGDGAIEEGRFWESLVFSAGKELPLDFIVEDNEYSMQSSIVERRGSIDLALCAAGIGVLYSRLEDLDTSVLFNGPRVIYAQVNTEGSSIVDGRKVNYHAGRLHSNYNCPMLGQVLSRLKFASPNSDCELDSDAARLINYLIEALSLEGVTDEPH